MPTAVTEVNIMPEWDNLAIRKQLYENREISWLRFNLRVLEEAGDSTVPLFERLRFLGIFCSNLDEFFMIRVGSLVDQTALDNVCPENKTLMSPQEQLDAIYAKVAALMIKRDQSYATLLHELERCGVSEANFDNMTEQELWFVEQYFENELLPLISPQVIDKQHPFPFLKNKVLYIGVQLAMKNEPAKLGVIPVTEYFDRVLFLHTERSVRFVLVENILLHFASRIFSKCEVIDRTIFRITRNADISVKDALDDHELGYRDAMQELLKRRRRLQAVRLEVSENGPTDLVSYLCEQLELTPASVFYIHSPLDMGFLGAVEPQLSRTKYHDLFFDPLRPQNSPMIRPGVPIIEQICKHDVLLNFPYHDIRPLINLIEQAADDPTVVSIKITLYRVAPDSQILAALIRAADHGKDVVAVVELQARFDEENNIDWSRRLEEAGCTVLYGLPGYKVHSKLLLITRRIGSQTHYVTQIGTGNYNEKTARQYTDLCLMTANREIGMEAASVFNAISLGNYVEESSYLMVAPLQFKSRILAMMDEEIAFAKRGEPASISCKLNGISDKDVIDKLIEASRAGVKILLLVRGICCIRSGIPGYTDNITVRSIVGRYLEHSRIYNFGVGARRTVWISSGDFMTRNCERRVEVAVRVLDPKLIAYLDETLRLAWADTAKGRVQAPDGHYERASRTDAPPLDSQRVLYEKAYADAKEAAQRAEQPEPSRRRLFWPFRKKDR